MSARYLPTIRLYEESIWLSLVLCASRVSSHARQIYTNNSTTWWIDTSLPRSGCMHLFISASLWVHTDCPATMPARYIPTIWLHDESMHLSLVLCVSKLFSSLCPPYISQQFDCMRNVCTSASFLVHLDYPAMPARYIQTIQLHNESMHLSLILGVSRLSSDACQVYAGNSTAWSIYVSQPHSWCI